MACDNRTQLLISCYVDGEASAEEATRAAAHLAECPVCRKMVEDWNGQRQLLEWACTFELPDEIEIQEVGHVEHPHRTIGARVWPWLRWNRRMAGSMAAVAVIVLIGYWFATLPPLLRVGSSMTTGSRAQSARLGDHITLRLGPDSRISRIDGKTVRLMRGWLAADVPHGTGFRVVAPRLQVVDRGTRFTVGTRPVLDYVVVEDGTVSVSCEGADRRVKAGQALIAQDRKTPWVADLPVDKPEDLARSVPLGQVKPFDAPQTAAGLDWDEGCQRLASVFPGLRRFLDGMGYGTAALGKGGPEVRHGDATLVGLRSGLREHFTDIAEALAGGTVQSGDWQIPVLVLLASRIVSTPQLPGDTYYVQLVCERGVVKWRLSGSRGNSADYPLLTRRFDRSCIVPLCGRDVYRREVLEKEIALCDWPGELKPTLDVNLGGVAASPERAICDDALRDVPKSRDLSLEQENPELLYLDSRRSHYLVVLSNEEATNQLCRLSDRAKQGYGGSVALGILATDVPLEEPAAPPGIYLLRFVLSGPTKPPHLELAALDRKAGAWKSPARALRSKRLASEEDPSGHGMMTWAPDPPPGYGRVDLSRGVAPADGNEFPVRIQVLGLPDDLSTQTVKNGRGTRWLIPTKVWAEGWVRVSKP